MDLKTGKFVPKYVGKMQFFLAILNDKIRIPDVASSIGIILLSVPQMEIGEKKRSSVAAYFFDGSQPPFMATQRTFLS